MHLLQIANKMRQHAYSKEAGVFLEIPILTFACFGQSEPGVCRPLKNGLMMMMMVMMMMIDLVSSQMMNSRAPRANRPAQSARPAG